MKAELALAPGESGGIDGDGAEPGFDGGGVAKLGGVGHQTGGDVLQEVFQIGPTGLVSENDGGDPAAVGFPDLLEIEPAPTMRSPARKGSGPGSGR